MRSSNTNLFVALLMVGLTAVGGCNHGSSESPSTEAVTIFAASSLRHDEAQWRQSWKTGTTLPLQFTFDASSRIARQVELGAPCHIVLSASEKWIHRLQKGQHLEKVSPLKGATNRLAVLQHSSFKRSIKSPEDLNRLDRIAIGGPNVPLGEKTREALAAHLPSINRVIVGRNAEQVFRLVESGEVDAAVVYLSDAAFAKDSRLSFVVPERLHTPMKYWVALLEGAPEDAHRFYDQLATGETTIIGLQGSRWAQGDITQ